MIDKTKYPHFIPDKPIGEDCFEGHSQQKLAKSVCDYIRMLDEIPDTKTSHNNGNTMPRIIGLEGGWGSGKSNVVNMIDREVNHQYSVR